MANWTEVDYARPIGRAMAFELKVVNGGGKLQLKPRHRTVATVASLAQSWTPARPPNMRNYESRTKLCGLPWHDSADAAPLQVM